MERIGEILKKARIAQGLSAEKVARAAGISFKSVWNIEHGGKTTTTLLMVVCDVLGLSLELCDKEE